jgi:hypothetical protein
MRPLLAFTLLVPFSHCSIGLTVGDALLALLAFTLLVPFSHAI